MRMDLVTNALSVSSMATADNRFSAAISIASLEKIKIDENEIPCLVWGYEVLVRPFRGALISIL